MPIFVLKPSLIYLSRSLFEIEVKVSAAMKDSAILLKWRRGVKEDTRIGNPSRHSIRRLERYSEYLFVIAVG